jgi:hypothetical protein
MERTVMKMLCTGNPQHATVASAVKKIWPCAEFASRTSGFDLRFWDPGSEDYFRKNIARYDVFINSSFICGNGQLGLLETTFEEWTQHGVKGTIVSIGSSAEFLGKDSRWGRYSVQKRALRDRGLQLHGNNGIKTTHLIAGGLNDGKPENQHALDLDHVANTIKWILEQPFCVPLIYLEADYNKRY